MIEKTMLIINSKWEKQDTISCIPCDLDCPYVEVILDPKEKTLAVLGTTTKQTYHMIPKLNEHGGIIKSQQSQKGFKEERRLIETYHEYYITEEQDIYDFLKMHCINFDKFEEKIVNCLTSPEAVVSKKETENLVVPE